MKSRSVVAILVNGLIVTIFTMSARAQSTVVPAGTILQCTLNEPNLSSATVEVGDPVLCHLRDVTAFGHQAFPRGSYLVGHLESAKDPGHFFGKGNLLLKFDRLGLPTGDVPLDAKIIATRGYKVDKEGKIDGKGHPKRDAAEWLMPPLWPWKVIMLPARGPRPKLKGETVLSLRLLDDVQLPQIARNFQSASRPSERLQRESFRAPASSVSRPAFGSSSSSNVQPSIDNRRFGPGWHFFDPEKEMSSPGCQTDKPSPMIRDIPPTNQVPAQPSVGSSFAAYSFSGIRDR